MDINTRHKSGRGGVPAVRRAQSLPIGSRNTADDTPLFAAVLKNSLWGLAAFAVSGIALVTLGCLIAYSNPDPDTLIFPLALLALLPSSFIGGLVSAKKTADAPVACGVVCGCVCMLFMMLLSLVLYTAPSSGYSFWQGAMLHLCAVGFSLLGALMGSIKPKAKKRKRRFG
jgi:putative membrane protein (TIGR04086 family)